MKLIKVLDESELHGSTLAALLGCCKQREVCDVYAIVTNSTKSEKFFAERFKVKQHCLKLLFEDKQMINLNIQLSYCAKIVTIYGYDSDCMCFVCF